MSTVLCCIEICCIVICKVIKFFENCNVKELHFCWEILHSAQLWLNACNMIHAPIMQYDISIDSAIHINIRSVLNYSFKLVLLILYCRNNEICKTGKWQWPQKCELLGECHLTCNFFSYSAVFRCISIIWSSFMNNLPLHHSILDSQDRSNPKI